MRLNRPPSPRQPRGPGATAFTLVEMIIVMVILVILVSIVTFRMTAASQRAGEAALDGDLSTLRKAVEMYQVEHDGRYPSAAGIKDQLTQFTDHAGRTALEKDSTHVYGPYLRAVPTLSVGTRRGRDGIAAADGAGVGWVYNETTGRLRANAAPGETDDAGKPYVDY